MFVSASSARLRAGWWCLSVISTLLEREGSALTGLSWRVPSGTAGTGMFGQLILAGMEGAGLAEGIQGISSSPRQYQLQHNPS